MDNFTDAYITCALWSSTDDESNPLDSNYSTSDIAPEAIARMEQDCKKFQEENATDLEEMSDESAGHDFWLTRNGHGAGFWDRGLGAVGDRLTAAAHAFGECDIYIGDDGQLYIS